VDSLLANMRRLDPRGPTSRRLVVDTDGATLGPDCALVRRTAAGYRCVDRAEAAILQRFLFGQDDAPDRLFILSRAIAKALSKDEVALAQIYGLRIPIAALDTGQLKQLAVAAPFIKANFNPDEPRDEHGRWTDEEEGGEGPALPPAAAVGATAAAETLGSVFGPLSRTALAGLSAFAAGLAGPVAFLGVLFLPTNSSLVTEETLPDRPDLSYRYDRDMGVLEIFRQDDGGRRLVIAGHLGTDGLFYGPGGKVIGRSLGSTAAVDPDALPAPAGRMGAGALTEAESAHDRPQLCPDPTEEDISGRKERGLAYQQTDLWPAARLGGGAERRPFRRLSRGGRHDARSQGSRVCR
jgi:hypothetical protein